MDVRNILDFVWKVAIYTLALVGLTALGGQASDAFIQYVFSEELAPDEYWGIPSILPQIDSRMVPVYFVNEDFICNPIEGLARGCYQSDSDGERITIVESKLWDWANQGCTVRDHEFFHAMHYGHGEGPLATTCPMPSNQNIYYDGNQVEGEHVLPDPLYTYVHPELSANMFKRVS